ncbi:Cro/CI family transcriptional regulator [Paraburkholderia dipogonis]|uniref:Cro/CI family transcriptional regulator n=1 Tax=Paraburkholderia dipogonis TaxID=1211383 RepID=UPI0038B92590
MVDSTVNYSYHAISNSEDEMTKSELIRRAGGVVKLAALLRVTSQAVSKWPDEAVPELRLYQLRDLHPEWFEVDAPRPDVHPSTVHAAH